MYDRHMSARASFRCAYCQKVVRLSATKWARAYHFLLDHVAECAPRAGAGYDEMREYISAVMADWPRPGTAPAGR